MLQRTVSHSITRATGWDAFLATVLPQAQTLEAGVAIVVVETKAIVSTRGRGAAAARFADRRGAAHACRVHAWVGAELPHAFFGCGVIVVDVLAERPKASAVLIQVAGLVNADAKV